MSTHNLCLRAKIRKNVYPCTPQFHYIKVGCKGVFITRTCLHDAENDRGATLGQNCHKLTYKPHLDYTEDNKLQRLLT